VILNDREIQELVVSHNLILNFREERLNSFGYDLTLGSNFLIPIISYATVSVIDPLSMDKMEFREFSGDFCIVPPNSFILGCSLEHLSMPLDLTGICLGRSSYARCGIITNVTPLEAGWRGLVTIEISNSTPMPAKVHAGKGITQVVFFKGNLPDRTYTGKGGKYQDQSGVTPARGL